MDLNERNVGGFHLKYQVISVTGEKQQEHLNDWRSGA